MVTVHARHKANTLCNSSLKIPRNYQAVPTSVLEGNSNIHARSLSSWTWRINFEENRIPKTISEADCTSSYCVNPKRGPGRVEFDNKLNSVPIRQELLVLRLNKTLGCFQTSYLTVN
ncbi:hypothetical protein JZ751_002451, partial [Albula glossodonta]